jgi:ribulose-5-phosphate 4-epimerase/fuculose-1-phosphate aldolase
VCVLAAMGVLPDLVHQTAALFLDDLRLVSEYSGEVDSAELGSELAAQIGDAKVAVLASHGVLITGSSIEEATYRAATIDRICRMAYDVMIAGRGSLPIDPGIMKGMKASLIERGADVYFSGAVRLLLRDEPDVLT